MATLVNIPCPAITRRTESKYDFAQLEVGGPGLVETDVIFPAKAASRLQSALAAARKRDPSLKDRKFVIRTTDLDGLQVVGAWRTA